jgi:peroxiredoxin
VYGVAWAGDERSFQDFVDRHRLTFPQLADADGAVYEHFEIAAQPAFAVIDRRGEVTTLLGALDEEQLAAALDEAIN